MKPHLDCVIDFPVSEINLTTPSIIKSNVNLNLDSFRPLTMGQRGY